MTNSALCCVVPNTTRNGLAGVLQRSLQPAFDDQVCFVATVRLAKPQFIKVLFYTDAHSQLNMKVKPHSVINQTFDLIYIVFLFMFIGDVYSGGAQ